MLNPSILFFGSFLHYSVTILQALHQSPNFSVVGVVTTPPKPAGRKQLLKITPVHFYAKKNHLPVFTPEKLDQYTLKDINHQSSIIDHLKNPPDLLIVAGYGKLLPPSWLAYPKLAAINVHFSLLPHYRGAMPAEWAILMGEKQTGVTLMEMSKKFDTGRIIAQAKLNIDQPVYPEGTRGDTRETLYEHLYSLGAKLAINTIPTYIEWKNIDGQPTNNVKSSKASGLRYGRIGSQRKAADAKEDNKLYSLGADLTLKTLPHYLKWKTQQNRSLKIRKLLKVPCKPTGKIENSRLLLPPQKQPRLSPTPWARLLTKQDSFLPWPLIQKAIHGQDLPLSQRPGIFNLVTGHWSLVTQRATRALSGYPSLWTIVKTTKGEKRLKILSSRIQNNKLILNQVQLEGQQPANYNQIKNQLS